MTTKFKKKPAPVTPPQKPVDMTKVRFSEDALVASICKDSFFSFVQEFWSALIPERLVLNWHMEYLCDELQKMAERVFKGLPKEYDLVVNIPPGTSKSSICSVFFPAWVWTRMQSARFIGASYSHPLAMDLSRKTRDVVLCEKYKRLFPEVSLRDDQNTKAYFANAGGGYRYSVGTNGSVMGMHAHFIVIDDPLDPEMAASTLDLGASSRWVNETLSTRKVDKAVTMTVLVMQRLHQDDPTALFLRRKKVKHVKLPAEDNGNVVPAEWAAKYTNKLLDPVRLPKSVLREEKQKGQSYYSSQFDQDPVPPGGAMFDVTRLKTFTEIPKRWARIVRAWDKAGTGASLVDPRAGAFTVGTLMARCPDGRFYVLDVVRVRLESFERERLIKDVAKRDGLAVHVVVEQEPGSGGKGSAEDTVRRLAGHVVKVIKVDKTTGGKVQRADPFSVQVNAGNVLVPKDAPWLAEWKEEFKYFPVSRYKDQVDSGAMAFSYCHEKTVRIGGALRGTPKMVYNQYGF